MSGAKIIAALQDAVAGDIARVTVNGQAWVREEELHSLRSKLAAAEAKNERLKEKKERLADFWANERNRAGRLESELTAANAQMRELGRQLAEAGEARIAAEASVAQMREALKPLARASTEFEWVTRKNVNPEEVRLWGTSTTDPKRQIGITVGDTFRAHEALTASPSDYRERVRREAFEEAAKVVEAIGESADAASRRAEHFGRDVVASHRRSDAETCTKAASAIRALGDSNANG